MNLEKELAQVFSLTSKTMTSNEYIQNNPDVMWIKKRIDLMEYVPRYGRVKDKENSYMNFKYLCNAEQKAFVYNFLKWCETNLEFINKKQLQRALKHWEDINA